jgi:hemerythrin
MLDALQMEYIEQLTRYLTDQYICTRFAVILPQTYLHFIQNVTVPDDLPSYKHGESFVKTQYNPEDTALCSADIFLNDFRMIGSVKFEDCAFDEKKKKVAESNIVLQESRVHMDIGDMGSTVKYVSLQHERQSIAFGIPYESLRNKRLYSNLDNDVDTLIDELVMLDLAVKGFSFKCLGAREPNYAEMNVQSVDTIIVTESVEILVGAVYSWLVFVDDLKGILASFQDQRSRQVQVFISEIANFSISQGVVGDPIFLTTPTSMLRLGSHNFRNDVGWKLLARMRHCLRSMPSSTREELQYRLTSGGALQDIDSKAMFANVVRTFSLWRNWEVSHNDIACCRLFTQPYKQKPTKGDAAPKNMTNEVVKFLTSSANFAKLRLAGFKFTIYEEETADMCKEENSISISYFEFLLECLYKSSPISSTPGVEGSSNNQRSSVPALLDGYLDIITKVSFGDIDISANPIILAFARHMLLVQRVFTAKLKSLSHASRSLNNTTANGVASSSSAPEPVNKQQEFSFDALLSEVDVVAQALVSLDRVQVTAHAQELRMDALVSGINGSALFSNPKLAPLQLIAHTDRDSDTGSGKRSSNRASRRSAYSEPRLVLEATGGINIIDIKFKEELHLNDSSTLLAIMLEKANVNANISQISKPSKKYGKAESSKDVLNVFSNIHKFHFNAPQSLLRLYGFIESWQTEQGRRYHFMFQNLVKEWEEQRRDVSSSVAAMIEPMPSTPNLNAVVSKKLDIKLQFLLNEFIIEADLLPSLSVEYRIVDLFFMVNETHQKLVPVRMYAFQLSKQVVHLITKDTKSASYIKSDNTSTFSIPGIRSTGSLRTETIDGVNQLKLRSMISVDLIAMSLDASMIDSLLTAQSLVGSEVSELVEVLSYSKRKNPTTTTTSVVDPVIDSNENAASARVFKYTVDVSLDGLRVSASSPSALGLFRSNVLEAFISNDTVAGTNFSDQLTWKLQARNFSLSLDHNTVKEIDDTLTREEDVYHRNVLAYILADFSVQNYLQVCPNEDCMHNAHAHDRESDSIFINFSRIQTVMQPIALGKLAEMYIYYNAELRKKKMMKKAEIDQLSANTKRIVQSISIKNEWPKALPEDTQSLLEGKIISLHVRRLGVAIPLGEQPDLTGTESSSSSRGASALLLSVTSIEFLSKNIEKGALQLDNFALQFVKRFDQNKTDHFIAENHPRMNQISFPSISCHVSASNAKPLQSVTVDARVRGFEVDVDGAIADYINTLSIIYVKSMDRVDTFTAKAKSNSNKASSSSSKPLPPPALDSSEVVHLDIEGKFECDSGTIRMYPKRHSDEAHKNKKLKMSLRTRPGFDARSTGEGNMATVDLPGLSSWVTYQTPLGAHASVVDAPKRFHADVLILESKNTLHPALVQFLHEIITGLKLGIQQSSERKADRDATAENESNLNASLFLRLSKTQLDLSCQPSSKVVCSLGWEESEFLMNAFSKDTTSRTMSCVGSIREITAVVKHHFSPEPCLNARIDRILFNAMLSSQREGGDSNDDISIIIEFPNILGDLNMRHLQDLLTLNACWFDQTIAQETRPSSPDNATPRLLADHLEVTGPSDVEINQTDAIVLSHSPAPFSKHVAVCVQNIKFSVDLGQNIGKVAFAPENLSFKLYHVPYESKGLSLLLEQIKVTSEGRLSGCADFKQTVLEAHLKQSNDGSTETSSICVRSEGFKATFEYEYQNILDAIQQSLELNIDLDKAHKKYDLQVYINLEALIARLSVKTVPVIITMVQKFDELLQKKKTEAGIRPTSTTTEMEIATAKAMSSTPSKDKYRYEHSSVHSRVSLSTQAVEVVIYPSQFQDSDNVNIRAKQFKVVLEEFPRNEEGVHRKLVITLSSAALAKNVPGKELMVRYSTPLPPPGSKPTTKNLGGTKIFGIPGTEITMESTQLDRDIQHEFGADFAGRVSVSLNIGLIKHLQEMINMFNLQLDRALDKTSDKLLQTPTSEPSTPLSNFNEAEENQLASRRPSLHPRGSQQSELVSIPSTSSIPTISVTVPTVNAIDNGAKEELDAPVEKYVYTSVNSVNFQPQLQVMGDATPPVEWLGLRRERIPGLVHENITLHLDQLVKVIWKVLESQAD